MKASQDNVLLWHADVEGLVYSMCRCTSSSGFGGGVGSVESWRGGVVVCGHGNSLRASFDLLSAAHRSTQVLKIMCSTSSTQEFYPARGYPSVLANMGHECSM